MGTKIGNRAYETDSIASDNSLSAPYILAISNKKGYLYILSEVSFMCGFANAQGGTLYIGCAIMVKCAMCMMPRN